MMHTQHQYDVLIIGSGAAGLTLALRLAERARIAVLSKGPVSEGNTWYAQGGISAVLDHKDSIESHIADTMDAGAGLCDPDAVRFTVEHGPEAVQWLIDLGVPFTRRDEQQHADEFHLTREGGHQHRRIIHAADNTGQAVETSLVGAVRARGNIDLFEQHLAIDLITADRIGRKDNHCLGAYVLDRGKGVVEVFRAKFTVLATGGASKVYLYTSNPDTATGDGIAMAWRAGCRVANMEFIQFHPTCLYHPQAKSFLITEAVRGEGGKLLLPDGKPFMQRFDPRGELAPRDIVARAIDHEMKRRGDDRVLLDISHKSEGFIRKHFPNDLPALPGARLRHGQRADPGGAGRPLHLRWRAHRSPRPQRSGRPVRGGRIGLHRPARRQPPGQQLPAGVPGVRDRRCPRHRQPPGRHQPAAGIPEWDESQVTDSDEEVVVSHNWDELRRFMWDYVGIVRTNKRLQRARRRVELLRQEIREYYGNFRVDHDLLELRNLVQVAELIIHSAQLRRKAAACTTPSTTPSPITASHPVIRSSHRQKPFLARCITLRLGTPNAAMCPTADRQHRDCG